MSPPTARRRPGTNRTADVVQRLGGRDSDTVNVTDHALANAAIEAVAPTMFYTVQGRLEPDPRIARDNALSVVEDAADDQDRNVIDQAIRVLGRQRGHVSANDVRELLPNVRPALIGGRFLAASKRGDLDEDGTIHATHTAGHGRRIVRWRWTGVR